MKGWLTITPPWDQRIAQILVQPLAATPITPNQVTTISLLLGVGGAILLAQGASAAYWGALLYMLAQFTDHMDGELARLTGQTSEFGHKYDHIAGGIFETALFCGIGLGLGAEVLGGWAATLGFITASAVAVTVTVRLEASRRFGNDSIDQPSAFGFEIEDIMYLVGPIAWCDGLATFLLLASIGLPIYMIITIWDFVGRNRARRQQVDGRA